MDAGVPAPGDRSDAMRSERKSTDATGWTDEERAAMREYAAEKKRAAARRGGDDRAAGEADVLARIASMADADRALAERVHALVTATAPVLVPRTWYGMPAYSLDGKVLCHFQDAAKFKVRYATIGFSDVAHLDDGAMWPVAFALTEMTPEVEARIVDLVRRAVG
jgi:uncharacterized protein YdhG (YjbR/CyaY superfamily)